MSELSKYIQSADWKKEKHAPVIEAPDEVKAGEDFEITLSIGKEIPHPNTTEHHISWISLYFKPDESKFIHHIGHFEFKAHGESSEGPNKGPVYNSYIIKTKVKLEKSGTFIALSLCNIHGLWESSKAIKVN